MKALTYFLSGLLFSLGLIISGMTRPQKIIGFLDFLGNWDPSLSLVMVGAIAVHFPAYLWVKGRSQPLWSGSFAVPSRRDVDLRLAAGAALFGIGWGLAGYCPGPALVSLASLSPAVFVFVLSMLGGMTLFKAMDAAWSASGRVHRSSGHHEVVAQSSEVSGKTGAGGRTTARSNVDVKSS